MANWRRLQDTEEILGRDILIREDYPVGDNVNLYTGQLEVDADSDVYIRSSGGKIKLLLKEYNYHYFMVDEILF